MNKQSGFSLLEVMVVLVIIGMIMSIVAPNIMGQQEEAAIDKAHLDIQQLEDAMSLYKLKNKSYPSTEQGLEALAGQDTTEGLMEAQARYLRGDLANANLDGEAGTDDDIGNWDEEKQ